MDKTAPSDSRKLRFLQHPNAAGIKERRRLVLFRCLEELLVGEVGGVEGIDSAGISLFLSWLAGVLATQASSLAFHAATKSYLLAAVIHVI